MKEIIFWWGKNALKGFFFIISGSGTVVSLRYLPRTGSL